MAVELQQRCPYGWRENSGPGQLKTCNDLLQGHATYVELSSVMALGPGIFACQPALFVVKEGIFNNSLPQEVDSIVPAAGWTPPAPFLMALRSLLRSFL